MSFVDLLSGVILNKRTYKQLYGIRPNSFYTQDSTEDGIAPPELLTALNVQPRVVELAGGGVVATPVTPSLIQCTGLPLMSDIIRGTFDTRLPYVQNPETTCTRPALTAGARVFTFPPEFVDQIVAAATKLEQNAERFVTAAKRTSPSPQFVNYIALERARFTMLQEPLDRFLEQYFSRYRETNTSYFDMFQRLPYTDQRQVRAMLLDVGSAERDIRAFGQEYARHKTQQLALLSSGTTLPPKINNTIGFKMLQLCVKMQRVVFAFLDFANTACISNCDIPEPRKVVDAARTLHQVVADMRVDIQRATYLLQQRTSWITAQLQGGEQEARGRMQLFATLFGCWVMNFFICLGVNMFMVDPNIYTVDKPYTFESTSSLNALTQFPARSDADLYELLCSYDDTKMMFKWMHCKGEVPFGTDPLVFPLITDKFDWFRTGPCTMLPSGEDPGGFTPDVIEKLKRQYILPCVRTQLTPNNSIIMISESNNQMQVKSIDSSLRLTPRPIPIIAQQAVLRNFAIMLLEAVLSIWLLRKSASSGNVVTYQIVSAVLGAVGLNKLELKHLDMRFICTVTGAQSIVSQLFASIDNLTLLVTFVPSLISALDAAGILRVLSDRVAQVLRKVQTTTEQSPSEVVAVAAAPAPGPAVNPNPNVFGEVIGRNVIIRKISANAEWKIKAKAFAEERKTPERSKLTWSTLTNAELETLWRQLHLE